MYLGSIVDSHNGCDPGQAIEYLGSLEKGVLQIRLMYACVITAS